MQARAIGDKDIGKFNDPEPFTCCCPFPASGRGDVVVCSDGVWDALLMEHVFAQSRKTSSSTAAVAARLIVNMSLQQKHAYNNEVFYSSSMIGTHQARLPCLYSLELRYAPSLFPHAVVQEVQVPMDDTSCVVFRIGEVENAMVIAGGGGCFRMSR